MFTFQKAIFQFYFMNASKLLKTIIINIIIAYNSNYMYQNKNIRKVDLQN